MINNTSTLRASNGGTLRLFQWYSDALQNQEGSVLGTIEALGDSRVLIERTNVYGGRIVTSNEGGVEEGYVELLSNVSLQNLELDAQAKVVGGATLHNSTFANLKTLTIDNTNLTIANQVAISGGGRIELVGEASISGETVVSQAEGTPKFINIDNTISTSSQDPQGYTYPAFFGEGLQVDNRGVIEANGADSILELGVAGQEDFPTSEAAWGNSGVIQSINGGLLSIGAGFLDAGGTINNEGGVIVVDEESSIHIGSVRISGGVIQGPSSQPENYFTGLTLVGASLDNVRLEGHVQIRQANNENLYLAGNIENTGTIYDQGFGTIDWLNETEEKLLADDEVTLTGGGEISVTGFGYDGEGSAKLINNDNTLRFWQFDNVVNLRDLEFINRGIVEANTPVENYSLSNINSDRVMTNSGVFRAIDGAILQIGKETNSTIKNYETDELGNTAQGTIFAGAGSVVELNSVVGGILHSEEGGLIRVNGSINYTDDEYDTFGIPSGANEIHLKGNIEHNGIVLAGTIRNDGVLTSTRLVNGWSYDDFTYQGLGSIRFIGSGKFHGDLLVPERSTLFNGPNHTISGGIILTDNLFRNEGRLEARAVCRLAYASTMYLV